MLMNLYGTIQCCKSVTQARRDWDLSVPLCAPSWLGHYSIVLWKNTIYPLMCWFVNYYWELYLASIQLLDVNEVVNFIKKINIML